MPTDSSTASTRATLLRFLMQGLLFLLLALVPSACTVTTEPAGSDAGVGAGGSSATTGSAVVSWTIASGKDATQCTTYGAASIMIQLTDSTGSLYGTATTAGCSAFSVTIPNLPPGTYGVTAQMVDASSAPVSTVAPSQSLVIVTGGSAAAAFDFPVSSFTAIAGTGTLNAAWTVASTTDAAQCTTYGAASIVIQLTDSTGSLYGTATTAPCSAFAATIPNLPPGTYGVTAQMVDASSAPVSTMIPSQSVIIVAGAAASVAFVFPASSFTAPTGTTGSLNATWTVASTTDAAECTTYGAASIVIQLTDSTGSLYGTATTAACAAFAATIPNLPPGTYGVTAQMVDASNAPVSTMIPSQTVTIVAGAAAAQAFDFPAASFTAPTGTAGSLNVTWTVASTTDAAQCTAHTAASIVIHLTSGGTPYGTATTAACSSFSTTIPNLPPGPYGVSAQMVDVYNAPVSTMVPPQSVTITAAATAAQAFDFPAASFTN